MKTGDRVRVKTYFGGELVSQDYGLLIKSADTGSYPFTLSRSSGGISPIYTSEENYRNLVGADHGNKNENIYEEIEQINEL